MDRMFLTKAIAARRPLGAAAQMVQMWHTFSMAPAVTPPTKRRVHMHTSWVDAALQPTIGMAIKRVLKSGEPDIRFPNLSGSEAAALMQAAGIVNEDGRLAKKYR